MRFLGIFFLLLSYSFIFSETFCLKEQLVLSKNKTQLKNLFSNEIGLSNEIFLSSRFYSSHEIVEILSKIKNDVMVLGKGINIKVVSPYSTRNFKAIIEENLKDYEILNFEFENESPAIYIENISNSISGDTASLFIRGYYFINEIGIETNIFMQFKVKEKEDKRIFLKNIGIRDADLYYINGDLSIRVRVRIIKRLPDGFYLVQNENKILKARAIDER